MFPLFELARVISLPRPEKDSRRQVDVVTYAWKESGERSTISLFLSNDILLISQGGNVGAMNFKQIPWYPEQPVTSLCYDPSGSWLLCTLHHALCIVPVKTLLSPDAPVSGPWMRSDVTKLHVSKQRGPLSSVEWWHAWDGNHFAVAGSKLGYVMLISLENGNLMAELDVHNRVSTISLVEDDSQSETAALITTESGGQWKVLLEQKGESILPLDDQKDIEEMGFENITSRKQCSILQISAEERLKEFQPMKYPQFDSSVMLTVQNAKGRHFIAAYYQKSHIYQVYESKVEHSPLYVHKMPVDTGQVVFTDHLMFSTSLTETSTLYVLSNQLSEVSLDDNNEFNHKSIIQQFELPPDEYILAVMKKSYPFYWHEKHEQSQNVKFQEGQEGVESKGVASIELHSHTVLDGCIVVTNNSVYHCRPRVSPERYFLELACQQAESRKTDQLAIVLGLNLNLLYRLLAEFHLAKRNGPKAMKYLQLAKCDHTQRIKLLLQNGFIKEALSILNQSDELHEHSSDVCSQHGELADLALQCYIQQLVSGGEEYREMKKQLRNFLLGNFSYDKDVALKLLVKHGLFDLLIELATERGLCQQTLKLMLDVGSWQLTDVVTKAVDSQGLASLSPRDPTMDFLETLQNLLSQEVLVDLLHQDSNLVTQLVDYLRGTIHNCHDEDLLLCIVKIFDPSKPAIQSLLGTLLRRHRNTRTVITSSQDSISSLDSGRTASSDISQPPSSHSDMLQKLVNFFLFSVFLLNDRRVPSKKEQLLDLKWNNSSTMPEKLPSQRRLVHHDSLVACGVNHTAVILDHQLYTWGSTKYGKLGLGEFGSGSDSEFRPCQVTSLSHLKLKVCSVSCGTQHTLALTDRGVYSWGGGSFGQLGVATRDNHIVPVHIPSLREAMVVKVCCGQYHSMALTANCRVYSWGWGVHGQLGHGDVEDQLDPKKIKGLHGIKVVTIAGGLGHSLVCTDQGDVYSFGNNTFGQLGHGNSDKSSVPKKISSLAEPIKVISTQFFHNVAVSGRGRVFTWGISPLSVKQHISARKQSRAQGRSRPRPALDCHFKPTLVDTSMVQGRTVKVSCGMNFSTLLTHDGELHTWGNNNEGQLGIAAHHDVKYPTIVPKINDVKVTHVGTGADYVVTMDTEAGLWVWGRNDAGQLSLKPTKPVRRPGDPGNSSSRRSSKKSSQELVCCVFIPTHVESVRLSLQESLELSGSMSSYRQKHRKKSIKLVPIEWWFEEPKLNTPQPEINLPMLEGDGNPEEAYPKDVILKVLKAIPQYCDTQSILQWCLDYKMWDLAAFLCHHLKAYPQGLHYHLMHVMKSKSACTAEDLPKTIIMLLEYYIRWTSDSLNSSSPSARKQKMTYLITMVQEVLEMWCNEDLAPGDLESYLLETSIMALPAFVALSRMQKSQNYLTPMRLFTNHFYFQLDEEVLDLIKKDAFYETVLMDGVSTPVTPSEMVLEGIKPIEKLIPKEKLWDDIFLNIHKGLEARSCIELSNQEVKTLVSSSNVPEQPSSCDIDVSPSQVPVRLFTCGHQFLERTLLEKLLPELETGLNYNGAQLALTSSLLQSYYKQDSLKALACPRCVLSALKG